MVHARLFRIVAPLVSVSWIACALLGCGSSDTSPSESEAPIEPTAVPTTPDPSATTTAPTPSEPTPVRSHHPPEIGRHSCPATGPGLQEPRGTRAFARRSPKTSIVNAFEAISPTGTHHTLLTVGEPDAPDGLTPCNAGANKLLSVYGSGVGPETLEFPEGVAMRIPAGTQLLLNLHLFNTSDQDLSGTSGTRVRVVQESEVVHIAEGLLAGTVGLNIPAGQTTTHTGYCTMSIDATVFAVAPHMHQLGIYEKVVAESSLDGDVVLWDGAYDFDDQSYDVIEPVQMAAGDRVRVECTHENTTNLDVRFGESTLSEMCFAGIYRYPSDGSIFYCIDEFSFAQTPPVSGI